MSTNFSPIMKWKAEEGEIHCIRFSPNETAVYTVGSSGEVRCTKETTD